MDRVDGSAVMPLPPRQRRPGWRLAVLAAVAIGAGGSALLAALLLGGGPNHPSDTRPPSAAALSSRPGATGRGSRPAPAPAVGQKGGSGIISATVVGRLVIGRSTTGDVARWLGRPDRVLGARDCGQGSSSYPWVGCADAQEWAYRCRSTAAGHAVEGSGGVRPQSASTESARCYTVYGFSGSLLIGLETTSPSFSTTSGTRVGTPLERALRAAGARWSGFYVQCPGIALTAPGGTSFLAGVAFGGGNPFLGGTPTHAQVDAFFVSSDTSSFNDNCPADLDTGRPSP